MFNSSKCFPLISKWNCSSGIIWRPSFISVLLIASLVQVRSPVSCRLTYRDIKSVTPAANLKSPVIPTCMSLHNEGKPEYPMQTRERCRRTERPQPASGFKDRSYLLWGEAALLPLQWCQTFSIHYYITYGRSFLCLQIVCSIYDSVLSTYHILSINCRIYAAE